MDAQPIQSPRPEVKSRRRWYQFSLRTLLLLVTLAGCGMGWLSLRVREARQREAAVAAIRALGGYIVYDDEFDAQGNHAPCAAPEPSSPAWPHDLLGTEHFRSVSAVFLSHAPLNDASLQPLAGLAELRILWLDSTPLTDAGLEHLPDLPHLEALRLSDTHVTDAGLERLRGLAQLKWLSLQDTQATAAGVARLQASLPDCIIDR